jgi:hypothetical protein
VILEKHPDSVPKVSLTPVQDVIYNLCGGDKDSIEYFNNYFAFVFQHKSLKPDTIMMIFGDLGGAGKTSLIINLFCEKILGSHDFFKAEKRDEVIGNHASVNYEGKRMLVLEEVGFVGDHECNALLKAVITGTTTNVNPKHRPPYISPNRLAVISLTNKYTPMDIGSRRLFAISPSRRLTIEEENAFYNFIEDDKNVRAVYQFYLDRDISNFDCRRDIPDSCFKETLLKSLDRWSDFGTHLKELSLPYDKVPMLDTHHERLECNDYAFDTNWRKLSTCFRMTNFRDYIMTSFSQTRSLGITKKGSSEVEQILKRQLGVEVTKQYKYWTKKTRESPWILRDSKHNPENRCVDIKSLIDDPQGEELTPCETCGRC